MSKRWDVLTARDDEKSGKTFWTRLGAAFLNKDGESISVLLDGLPVNGKLQLRVPREKNREPSDDTGF